MGDVTQILADIDRGDPHAAEQLLPLVYEELRRLATQKMAHEAPDQTLQPTALVHEAYLRMVDVEQARHWNSRTHFFRAAAEAIRRILVENARRKNSLKRGGDRRRVDLEQAAAATEFLADDVLDLNTALERLVEHAPEKAELVKLRYFGGLSIEEAAEVLGISRATAARHWGYAKTWLYCRLTRDSQSEQS